MLRPGPTKHRPKAMRLVKPAFGLVLLLLLAEFVDWRASLAILAAASPTYVAFACLAGTASILVSSWRWRVILRGNGLRPPFGLLLRYYWIGRFFGHFLPGAVGGDVARIALMRPFGRPADVAASLVVERLTGLAVLLALAAVSLLARPPIPGLSRPALSLAVAAACALAVLVPLVATVAGRLPAGRIPFGLGRAAERFARSVRVHLKDRETLRGAPLISVLFYAVYALFHALVLRAVHGTVPPLDVALLVPLVAVMSHLPLVPNGLGVADGAFVLLFTQAGLTPETALAAAVLRRLAMVAVSLPGALLWVAERPRPAAAAPAGPAGSR